MLIDWFTVGAQALNFVILVWLMKRFLYKPILHAIDAREKRIAAELADADAKKAEAQKERTEFEHKNEALDQERTKLLSEAQDAANAEGERLQGEARKAAQALQAKQEEILRNEAHDLSGAIGRQLRDEVFSVARTALKDLADTSLEERMVGMFTRRLRAMEAEPKARMGAAMQAASEPALVRSAFELPAAQRAAMQNALNETFSAEVRVRFATAPDLIGGIELATNGQKVAWSLDDYLVSLEKSVAALVDKPIPARDESQSKPAPAAAEEAHEHGA